GSEGHSRDTARAIGSGDTSPVTYVRRVRRGSNRPKSAAKDDIPSLQIGQRVLHDSYGLGTVMDIHGQGKRLSATIDFGDGVYKRLLLRYAPLSVIDEN
ncbi:MAG: hypothetical protein Q4Q03_06410, partial [Bowdeniella nasicola]|nr:hypothetical protein [Bowdeniella nasicola]